MARIDELEKAYKVTEFGCDVDEHHIDHPARTTNDDCECIAAAVGDCLDAFPALAEVVRAVREHPESFCTPFCARWDIQGISMKFNHHEDCDCGGEVVATACRKFEEGGL